MNYTMASCSFGKDSLAMLLRLIEEIAIEKGYCWDENGVELYSILDRVSCWCCCNKNKKELYNIWLHLPQYWERLKELQSKLDRPMKQICNKKYGHYGNVFDMEKAFLDMFIQQKGAKSMEQEVR